MGRKVAVTFILGLDCLYDLSEPLPETEAPAYAPAHELPAPIFAIEAPEVAEANKPFSVNAWVALGDPLRARDEVLPESFSARVDPFTHQIVVTGLVRRQPGADAHGPRITRALVVGIRVTAPAGMWRVAIPPTHFVAGDNNLAGDVPPPRACRWIQVR